MRAQPAERAHTPVAAARNSPAPRTVTPAGRFLAELGGMCGAYCVLTIVAMLGLMFYRRSQYSGAQVAEAASAPPPELAR